MQEAQIVGMFESGETAADVARALNAWFTWVMENDGEHDIPEFFEDFGIASEEYSLTREDDTDWEECPIAKARGNHLVVYAYTAETVDMLQELVETLGAFEVEVTIEGES